MLVVRLGWAELAAEAALNGASTLPVDRLDLRLDPKIDLVFKLLFTRNEALLRSMLEAVLHLPSPIQSIEILNPGMPGELPPDKFIFLDIRLRLNDDREVDVEMQSRSVPGLSARLRFRPHCTIRNARSRSRGRDPR